MKIVNDTHFTVGWTPGRIDPPQDALTIIVKGRFRVQPDAPLGLVDADSQAPLSGDLFTAEERRSSCRYDSDFAHFKPRADLLLVGHCHTPKGEPLRGCQVTFHVGSKGKSIWVFGDRKWERSLIGLWKKSDPQPFTSMPLEYEYAYGGKGYDLNPVGKGFGPASKMIPNLESHTDEKNTLFSKNSPKPAGFGPIDRTWAPRIHKVGTYKSDWVKTRWPWFPKDFDWGYFNAAPEDMQVDGYLRGDEPLYFENLHPQHSLYHSKLPGLRIRCFVCASDNPAEGFGEVAVHLDTLWVDMDAEQAVLVWRGVTEIESPDYEELKYLYLTTEDLAREPHPKEHYRFAFSQRLSEASTPIKDVKKEKAEAPEAKKIDTKETDPELEKAIEQTKEMLAKAGLDPALMDQMLAAENPALVALEAMQRMGLDPAQGQAALKASQENLKKMLKEHGVDDEEIMDFIDGNIKEAGEKIGSIRISQTSLVPEMTNFCRYEAFEKERLSGNVSPIASNSGINRSFSNAIQ